jgi:hypothetical protein
MGKEDPWQVRLLRTPKDKDDAELIFVTAKGGSCMEHVSDERLRRVSNHVRTWFFADSKKGGAA